MRCDPVVVRATLRMMNLLKTPPQAFGNPEVARRSRWVMACAEADRRGIAPPPAPDQEDTIALCDAAVAS